MTSNSKQPEENGTHDWNILFEEFVIEKEYMKGVTPRTLQSYREAWKAFNKFGKAEISEQGVKTFMIEMIRSGVKPGAANAFARSMNSLFSWAHENKHTQIHFKIPLRKLEKRVLRTYKPEEVSRILSYKPETFAERRLIALLTLLVDTGARIEEALTLTRSKIDLDSHLISVPSVIVP